MGTANQTRGIAPGPSRAIGPAPRSGNCLAYPTYNFPLGQENPADASRKRLPCVKGAGPQGLRDCRLPSQKHAETLWQMQIAILRIGCGTAAHGPAAIKLPPTGCKASGENSKKGAGGNSFPSTPFFCFHYARGAVFRLLNFHANTTLLDKIVCRTPGAGVIPLPRGTGGE